MNIEKYVILMLFPDIALFFRFLKLFLLSAFSQNSPVQIMPHLVVRGHICISWTCVYLFLYIPVTFPHLSLPVNLIGGGRL